MMSLSKLGCKSNSQYFNHVLYGYQTCARADTNVHTCRAEGLLLSEPFAQAMIRVHLVRVVDLEERHLIHFILSDMERE
jgi:hypothetical protein